MLHHPSDLTVNSSLPVFRKSLYTQEIINYILDEISSGAMTKNEVIGKYRIPKTTLHKWISKNKGKLLRHKYQSIKNTHK